MSIEKRVSDLEQRAARLARKSARRWDLSRLSTEELEEMRELRLKAGPDGDRDLSLLSDEELERLNSLYEKALVRDGTGPNTFTEVH